MTVSGCWMDRFGNVWQGTRLVARVGDTEALAVALRASGPPKEAGRLTGPQHSGQSVIEARSEARSATRWIVPWCPLFFHCS